jgi:alpha-beta hydrolase superfamily lysophospholipase
MNSPRAADDRSTIVLIHGLWLTPLAWEHWVDRYSKAGHRVIAPAWPGIEALRADPSVMNGVGVTEVAEHYEKIIRGMRTPPILIGHSFGGVLVQILLDRGLGRAGIAIAPAPVKGVFRLPISSLRSAFPVLSNPGNRRRTVALSPEQWHYGFTNTLGEAESKAAYDRYHVPSSGRPLWQAATANLLPNPATKVNFRNGTRAPLLIIAGGADHTVPPALNRENYRRYDRSAAITDYKEFPYRPHFTIGVPGWEAVADYALGWVAKHGTTHLETAPA